jgi:hypothetical protein
MVEKIFLDMLTQDSVSIRKQKYVVVDDAEYAVGDPWRRAYVNNTSGRQQVQDEVPEPYLSAIMAVWGTEPTVEEPDDHPAE